MCADVPLTTGMENPDSGVEKCTPVSAEKERLSQCIDEGEGRTVFFIHSVLASSV